MHATDVIYAHKKPYWGRQSAARDRGECLPSGFEMALALETGEMRGADHILVDLGFLALAGRWPFLLLSLYSSIFLPKVFLWMPKALAAWD